MNELKRLKDAADELKQAIHLIEQAEVWNKFKENRANQLDERIATLNGEIAMKEGQLTSMQSDLVEKRRQYDAEIRQRNEDVSRMLKEAEQDRALSKEMKAKAQADMEQAASLRSKYESLTAEIEEKRRSLNAILSH